MRRRKKYQEYSGWEGVRYFSRQVIEGVNIKCTHCLICKRYVPEFIDCENTDGNIKLIYFYHTAACKSLKLKKREKKWKEKGEKEKG